MLTGSKTCGLCEAFPDHIQAFTDAPVDSNKSYVTAAMAIPVLGYELVGRLAFQTFSTTAELVVIPLPIENFILLQSPGNVVLPTDFIAALLQLHDSDRSTFLDLQPASKCRNVEDTGWNLSRQYVHPIVKFSGMSALMHWRRLPTLKTSQSALIVL